MDFAYVQQKTLLVKFRVCICVYYVFNIACTSNIDKNLNIFLLHAVEIVAISTTNGIA